MAGLYLQAGRRAFLSPRGGRVVRHCRGLLIGLVGVSALTALTLLGAGQAFHAGTHDLAASPAELTVLGAESGDLLGWAVAAGDFNADGIDDLLLGAPNADGGPGNPKSGAGEAYVIFGENPLPATVDLLSAAPDFAVFGADVGDQLGHAVASGDLNGDDVDDILLGAPFADGAGNGKAEAGEAYVIFGSPSLSGSISLATTAAAVTIIGADPGDQLGFSLASGRINGDVIGDLLVAAPTADAGPGNPRASSGEVYAIFGSGALASSVDLSIDAPSLAVLGVDVGDQLGSSLASGDVNGDTIDDILIGAIFADAAANTKTGAGEVYAIFGSASLPGDIDLSTTSPDFSILGADPMDFLGSSLASGDLNGDTFLDIVVGAHGGAGAGDIRPGAGEAYAVFGSASLSGSIDLATTPPGLTVLGAETFDELARGPLATGDFNHDTIDDILLGAAAADAAGNAKANAGEAYAIFGSTGLSGTRDIAASEQDFTVLGADSVDRLGRAAAVGDFNGDGIDDALLGAHRADSLSDLRPDAGESYVVLGGGPDTDGDGLFDVIDNCQTVPNGPNETATPGVGNQTNTDGDGLGDACDPDDDDDEICDDGGPLPPGTPGTPPGGCAPGSSSFDNCRTVPNGPNEAATPGVGNQTNTDVALAASGASRAAGVPILGDALGDACDEDDENDSGPIVQDPGGAATACPDGTLLAWADCVEAYLGTDPLDNCAADTTPNNEALDALPPDTNDDQSVNIFDLPPVFDFWLGASPRHDLNADGAVNIFDVAQMFPFWLNKCT